MLLNKYFEILKHYTENLDRELYGRELAKKLELSQKTISLTLKELEKQSILRSRIAGNIKLYSLNKKHKDIKDILTIMEIQKKIKFLEKHRKLKEIFEHDKRITGIFGSYAKGLEREDSDIDIFIIGEEKKEDYEEKGEIYDLEISAKYFKEEEFKKLLRKKNNLMKEIIKNHILTSGAERFISIIWEEYYDFD